MSTVNNFTNNNIGQFNTGSGDNVSTKWSPVVLTAKSWNKPEEARATALRMVAKAVNHYFDGHHKPLKDGEKLTINVSFDMEEGA